MKIYMLLIDMFLKKLCIMCQSRVMMGEGSWQCEMNGMYLKQWHVPEAAMYYGLAICNGGGTEAARTDDWHVPEAAIIMEQPRVTTQGGSVGSRGGGEYASNVK